MTNDTQALLRRIIAKDNQALLQHYEQFGGLVFSIAIRVVGDQQIAEEVTQDVFMKVWEKATSFDAERAKFTTWLGQIARNAAIDTVRKQDRRTPDEGSFSIDDNPYVFEKTVAADYETSNPVRAVALHNALKDLPEEQASLIEMAYFGGMTHTDIAAYTGLPLGTVKSRIRAGMQKLRDAWHINPKVDS